MTVSVGPLCLSKHNGRDRRLDDDFSTFRQFNRTLMSVCEPGKIVPVGSPGWLRVQSARRTEAPREKKRLRMYRTYLPNGTKLMKICEIVLFNLPDVLQKF